MKIIKLYILISSYFLLSCTTFSNIEGDNLLPKTADKDPSVPSLVINDCTFHLRTYGNPQNPTIIFLHGGAADLKPFIRFIDSDIDGALIQNFHIVLYDQRGKGLSQRFNNSEDITFDIYKEDLRAIINYFSPDKKVILVAHSFGGIIASDFMNTYPDKIKGAVFIEPGAFKYVDSSPSNPTNLSNEWVNDLMWSQQIIGASTHDEVDLNFAAMLLADDFNADGESHEIKPFWRIGAAAQAWIDKEKNSSKYDYTKNLKNIENEILFITGSESTKLGTTLQKKNMRHFNKPILVEIRGVEHAGLLWSKIDMVLLEIKKYLTSLELKKGDIDD